jgi:predicted AAA+ superfamily ATPase
MEIENLIDKGYIISLSEIDNSIHKKYYLVDPALQNSLEKKRNFYRLFEAMVISELYKTGESGNFFRTVDLVTESGTAILIRPFIDSDGFEKIVKKMILKSKKLHIKRVEIVTMDFEINRVVEGINFESLKFSRWAILQ